MLEKPNTPGSEKQSWRSLYEADPTTEQSVNPPLPDQMVGQIPRIRERITADDKRMGEKGGGGKRQRRRGKEGEAKRERQRGRGKEGEAKRERQRGRGKEGEAKRERQ
jgi:hypothetical protein